MEVLESHKVATFSFIFESKRENLEAQWIRVRVGTDDGKRRVMSIWCVRESRRGLSLWLPADRDVGESTPALLSDLWIDQDVVGMWRVWGAPRGFYVWVSEKKTASMQETREWAIQSFIEILPGVLDKVESRGLSLYLVGHVIDLDGLIGDDHWFRGAPSSSVGGAGGVGEIDRIVPRGEGWLVLINGLDGIRYEVKLDGDFQLIDGKRIGP